MTNEEIWDEFTGTLNSSADIDLADSILAEVDRAFEVRGVQFAGATWDVLIATINYGLTNWLVTKNRQLKSKHSIDRARDALCVPDNKQYVKFWCEDIRRLFIPKARRIALDLE